MAAPAFACTWALLAPFLFLAVRRLQCSRDCRRHEQLHGSYAGLGSCLVNVVGVSYCNTCSSWLLSLASLFRKPACFDSAGFHTQVPAATTTSWVVYPKGQLRWAVCNTPLPLRNVNLTASVCVSCNRLCTPLKVHGCASTNNQTEARPTSPPQPSSPQMHTTVTSCSNPNNSKLLGRRGDAAG